MERSIGVKRVEINVKETEMMISSENLEKATEEGKFSCAVAGPGCIRIIVVLELN